MILHDSYPGVVTATIDEHEVRVIHNATADLVPHLHSMTETDFLDTMAERAPIIREQLPELTDFLGKVSTHEGAKVAIIDFPASTIGNVRPTPLSHLEKGDTNLFAPDVYRGMVVGMAGWYGYGYTTQQNAAIHNNIVQVKELAPVAGHSASASHELGLHVEDASYNLGEGHDISPDFLTLHYFRNPKEVPTIVSMPKWDELSRQSRDLLSEAWFYNRTNPAQGGEANNPDQPVSVIYGPAREPWMRLNTAKLDIEHYTPDQQKALMEIRDHLESHRLELALRAGQIAVIDNRRVLHGRPAFKPGQEPSYDGTDRWQRRLTVSVDAERIRQHEDAYRVVNPENVL